MHNICTTYIDYTLFIYKKRALSKKALFLYSSYVLMNSSADVNHFPLASLIPDDILWVYQSFLLVWLYTLRYRIP